MCWITWEKLTLPKEQGSLGFREIESFNDAFLAKLTWRIMNNPTSLISRVLLVKYCQHNSIMEAHPPSNPSHGWREILAGRDIIKKELG
ncbi:putative mitochondrial protein [Cardamine amara subsp. amara]|uniref:Mitochondrial protein n=1 Tax=Cardamine amara subsp. amara TaxID=228776 RepID=A0ABD1C1V8_CARAN